MNVNKMKARLGRKTWLLTGHKLQVVPNVGCQRTGGDLPSRLPVLLVITVVVANPRIHGTLTAEVLKRKLTAS